MININRKKIFFIFAAAVILLSTLLPSFTVSANGYSNTEPYCRRWLDAINNYVVIDYYTYSQAESAYVKSITLNVKDTSAYCKTTDYVITTSLLNEDDIGFSADGTAYYITDRYELCSYNAYTKANNFCCNDVASLEINDSNFVEGYYTAHNEYYTIGGSNNNGGNNNGNNNNWNNNNNGNNWNNNWNNGNNNGNNGNNNWNNGNNNGNNGNNNWNNGNNNGNNWNNNSKYPYITVEDNTLTYVESSSEHHSLFIKENYLVFNNIILYKHGVIYYGFAKGKVVYITDKNRLVTYEFGAKKQYVKSTKVTSLIYDDYGFVIGYKKSNGKTYSI